MTTPLRALTLWPEWAWAIHHLDKRVENRIWKIPKDEWVMLHAGKYIGGKPGRTLDGLDSLDLMLQRAGCTRTGAVYTDADGYMTDLRDHPILTSRLLGAFRVLDHHAPHHGNLTGWRVPDQVGNVFEYRPLAAPVPCKGAQGLWHVPDDVRERLTWP